jgi:signal transduction histidine kinase
VTGPDSRASLLLVDDRPANLLSLEAVLEALGHRLVHASTGEKALECVGREEFAVILLDVQMPGLDGFATAERIRQSGHGRSTPIIFMTAHERDREGVTRAYELGAVDYLTKPFEPAMLRAKARTFIELHLARRQAREQATRAEAERLAHERERLQQVEAEARARVEEAGRLKDEFLATVSHELRTPLNAILGWSQLLRRDGTFATQRERACEIIERNARVQAKLVDELLDVGRLASGNVRLRRDRVRLAEIAREALETLTPAAAAKRLAIETSFHDPGEVVGDAERLRQVAWNLLANAVKFSPVAAAVRVAVRREGDAIVLAVDDAGPGIAAEFLPHLFEPFRQGDASTTRPYGGLGLGLSVARRLVELHGGSITAASEGPQHGASFRVWLHAAPPAEAPPKEAPSAPPPAASLHGLRVLVAAGEADAGELWHTSLALAGADVATVHDARAARSALAASVPDVLVLDVDLPDESGHALIRRLRHLGDRHAARVPAVALTSFVRTEDRLRALEAGFDAYVPKPAMPAELRLAVARAARRYA